MRRVKAVKVGGTMKFEHIFMGYIIFVIARFYCCVIRDQISTWGKHPKLSSHG
jgi:hypothetical protein